jgi:hypothetical protein
LLVEKFKKIKMQTKDLYVCNCKK